MIVIRERECQGRIPLSGNPSDSSFVFAFVIVIRLEPPMTIRYWLEWPVTLIHVVFVIEIYVYVSRELIIFTCCVI